MSINNMELYERSNNFLWTDEYISKQMLKYHLKSDCDAASRTFEKIKKTVTWLSKQIPQNASIIDLGCGPGLYSEQLSKLGYKMTGVDISALSIDYAKNKTVENNSNIDYYNKSYLEPLNKKYDAAICIFCDFAALIPSEQKIFLQNVHNALNKNGILIFDIFDENMYADKKSGKSWKICNKADFFSECPHYLLTDDEYFIEAKAWGRRNVVIDIATHTVKDFITWDTLYSKDRIREQLNENGFETESISENILCNIEENSDHVLFVKAKKK